MTLKASDFDNVLDLNTDDIRVTKYLRGETLELSDDENKALSDGYILICVNGFSLGFGKLSKGIIKNKYLPGWRMM